MLFARMIECHLNGLIESPSEDLPIWYTNHCPGAGFLIWVSGIVTDVLVVFAPVAVQRRPKNPSNSGIGEECGGISSCGIHSEVSYQCEVAEGHQFCEWCGNSERVGI